MPPKRRFLSNVFSCLNGFNYDYNKPAIKLVRAENCVDEKTFLDIFASNGDQFPSRIHAKEITDCIVNFN